MWLSYEVVGDFGISYREITLVESWYAVNLPFIPIFEMHKRSGYQQNNTTRFECYQGRESTKRQRRTTKSRRGLNLRELRLCAHYSLKKGAYNTAQGTDVG